MNAELGYQYNQSTRKVNQTAYSGRVRLYCDIDGVVLPFSFDPEYDFSNLDKASIHYDYYKYNGISDQIEHIQRTQDAPIFRENLERLVKLSKHPEVDFVWLTAWRENALILDQNFGFESVGYLPWQKRMGDYNQTFKKVALQRDQELSPSKFIWLDDMANITDTHQKLFSSGLAKLPGIDRDERYLSICTTREVGVSEKELDQVFEWIEK